MLMHEAQPILSVPISLARCFFIPDQCLLVTLRYSAITVLVRIADVVLSRNISVLSSFIKPVPSFCRVFIYTPAM